MPPLIPVERPVAEAIPNPKSKSMLQALQLRARARGRGRGRGRGINAKAMPRPPARTPLKLKDLQGPVFAGAAAAGAGLQTAQYGKRAGDLAAALDKITPPSLASVDSEALPAKKFRKYCMEGALEEVEVSKEARAKSAVSLGDDFVDSEASESDDELDDNDDDEDECAPKKKKRKGPGHVKDVPPGAPAAASASEEVLSAISSAEGAGDAVLPGGSSFGPRFSNLSQNELAAARSKWQLHSLAGTEQTSSEDNRKAAADLFAILRQRREAREGTATQTEEVAEAPSRPVFRRPRAKTAEAEAPPAATRTEAFSTPGVRILEECVAGSGQRVPGRRKAAEDVPVAVNAAKKRKTASVCVAQDADG
ncbi:NIP1-1 [Symbiodinium pilosum]|uniref:NIP1-1 protein n=1 Tax=Symbiodinium pilosum TaxID=2952 RepID=A0A812MCT7_SYMPI|nr:NIP1-1 [Symbiodinium pilosum]